VGFVNKPSGFEAPGARRQVPPAPHPGSLARTILLAVLVAIAAGWAVARHYSMGPSVLTPAATPTGPTYDEDAGELSVPEIIEGDAS
jgi:hypothetical protein